MVSVGESVYGFNETSDLNFNYTVDSRPCSEVEKVAYSDCFEPADQGSCVALLPPKYRFELLCQCKRGFSGKHCETFDFDIMSIMRNHKTVIVVGVLFVVIMVAGAVAFGVYFRHRRKSRRSSSASAAAAPPSRQNSQEARLLVDDVDCGKSNGEVNGHSVKVNLLPAKSHLAPVVNYNADTSSIGQIDL